MVKDGNLPYDFGNETWTVCTYVISENRIAPSYDPMNPQSGKAYNPIFFRKFENALTHKRLKRTEFFLFR